MDGKKEIGVADRIILNWMSKRYLRGMWRVNILLRIR
jgi:hypothetical protein